MKILALFFLGIVQGLTEFLPVSSSGHIVLFSKLFGIEESLLLSIFLHLATLFSIFVVFYKDILEILKKPFSDKTMKLVTATIPTCIIALLLMPIIKSSFSGDMLWLCFFFSAAILFFAEKVSKKIQPKTIDYKTAILIGIFQGIAIFPGVSRSGSTISAGLFCGRDKKETAKFSFLLSVPIILMSLVLEVFEIATQKIAINGPIWAILLSCVCAFVIGVFALKSMVKLTEKANLKWFSLYLIVVGFVSLFLL